MSGTGSCPELIDYILLLHHNYYYWPPVLCNTNNSPSRLEISELCIFGLSWAILRRCSRDQTMNAFIGRLMCCSSACRFVVVWLIRLQKRLDRDSHELRAFLWISIDGVLRFMAAHLVLFELFMMWWWPLWAVVYREAAAAAAAATLVDALLCRAVCVCRPSEFREEWPEWWWWLFSDACWLSECEDRDRPGRASDGNLSIILTPFRAVHLCKGRRRRRVLSVLRDS